MAKKSFNILDDLPDGRSGKKPESFDNPLNEVSSSKLAKATGKKLVRGRIRKTIYLPPAQMDYIEKLAAENGIGLMDFYQWIIDRGLMDYDHGERPEAAGETVVVDVHLEHWSSRGE